MVKKQHNQVWQVVSCIHAMLWQLAAWSVQWRCFSQTKTASALGFDRRLSLKVCANAVTRWPVFGCCLFACRLLFSQHSQVQLLSAGASVQQSLCLSLCRSGNFRVLLQVQHWSVYSSSKWSCAGSRALFKVRFLSAAFSQFSCASYTLYELQNRLPSAQLGLRPQHFNSPSPPINLVPMLVSLTC